jgi:hypothetical protein
MKITVVTDQDGKVLGTALHHPAAGQPVARPVAGPGQKIHELELPSHLEAVESAEALHSALERLLASA